MEFKEMLIEKVNLVRRRFTGASELLTNYLHKDGDSTEVLIQKRIWWLLMVSGLPVLLIMSLAIFGRAVNMVNTLNIIFGSIMLGSLLIFHFYKSHIELHILLIQLTILSLTIMKVYLMGGLFYAGTPIFVGFAAPLYALTTRNRKRALLFFLIYLSGMIIATELQPIAVYESYVYHYGGFLMGTGMAFFGLYYYTGQLELLKEREKIRMRELDETKNKFYTHITHEFRTPLTIIQGMADQIKEDPKADLTGRLNMIRNNGSKLLSMTNQLLDLSKLKANILPMHWVQQDIIAFLSYQVESFRSYAEWKNLELTFIKAEEPLVMDQDTEKLGEVMSNLISNAIKFSKEGGKVIVKVWTERRGDDERCHILVKDQGCGISEENLDRVFDPYFRVDRGTMDAIPGTGLGLAITRELVMLMQGSIHATSEPGIGTSFELSLPITNKAESQLAADFEKEPEIPGFDHEAVIEMTKAGNETGLKLLLVEDNH